MVPLDQWTSVRFLVRRFDSSQAYPPGKWTLVYFHGFWPFYCVRPCVRSHLLQSSPNFEITSLILIEWSSLCFQSRTCSRCKDEEVDIIKLKLFFVRFHHWASAASSFLQTHNFPGVSRSSAIQLIGLLATELVWRLIAFIELVGRVNSELDNIEINLLCFSFFK